MKVTENHLWALVSGNLGNDEAAIVEEIIQSDKTIKKEYQEVLALFKMANGTSRRSNDTLLNSI